MLEGGSRSLQSIPGGPSCRKLHSASVFDICIERLYHPAELFHVITIDETKDINTILAAMPFDTVSSMTFMLLQPLIQIYSAATQTHANIFFVSIAIFRYLRLVVGIFAYYFLYKPTPIPANPTYTRQDATVIIPTIDPENEGFQACLRTSLQNQPGAILIVTVGKAKVKLVKKVIKPFRKSWPSTTISVTQTEVANKRRQVCHALPQVKTPITVLCDDSVWWPSLNFLPSLMAPFEDLQVGGVGTHKIVKRTGSGYSINSVFNFLGCLYLLRHSFDLTATNAIDGSVFVISGRTAAYRTQILQDQAFINNFSNEMFFFGKLGPILPDDDNALTRWLVTHGWKIKFQHCPDATIMTNLGNPSKYLSQCLRWVRTTWRSNSCSLFTDRTVWRSQPWGVYAIYIGSFFNFALFYDAALLISLYRTTFGHSSNALLIMAAIIFISKMIKLIPHFIRCPGDIMLIPAYIIFAYYHSLMKLWALFTFYDCAWGGRNLGAVNAAAQGAQDDDSDSSDDDDNDDHFGSANSHFSRSPGSPAHSSYSTGSSYNSAKSQSTTGYGPTPRSGYTGPSYGKSAIFNRFYESDVAAPMQSAATPSSAGFSDESASYGISQWAAWEKASYPDREVNRAKPIPIVRTPAGFPQPARATPSPKPKGDTTTRLSPKAGLNPPAWDRVSASTPSCGYRSPINTRSYAASKASTASTASVSCFSYSSVSSPGTAPTVDSRASFASNAYSNGKQRPQSPPTPRLSGLFARTHLDTLPSTPTISVESCEDCPYTPHPGPCSDIRREYAAWFAGKEVVNEAGVEAEVPSVPRPEYRRSWERGQDCQRQHDEGMDLKFKNCGLPKRYEEFSEAPM